MLFDSSRCAQLPNCPSHSSFDAMERRPEKLARLQSLRSRLPYVSKTALSRILTLASQEALPGSSTRDDVRRARDTMVMEPTPYGMIHQTISLPATEGDPLSIEVQHPFPMFWYTCKKSDAFSRLVARTMASNPCTVAKPWSLILYADEITPGNQLAYKNARKMWAMYWTILDLGSAALSDEDCFFDR